MCIRFTTGSCISRGTAVRACRKSETRRPTPEKKPSSVALGSYWISDFGLLVSDFFRASAFGFRI